MNDLMDVIQFVVPDAKCAIRDNIFIEWHDERPQPTQAQLDAAQPAVQAATLQSQANATARAYLASTDWMVLRQADSGEAMPSSIKDARAAARLEIKP